MTADRWIAALIAIQVALFLALLVLLVVECCATRYSRHRERAALGLVVGNWVLGAIVLTVWLVNR